MLLRNSENFSNNSPSRDDLGIDSDQAADDVKKRYIKRREDYDQIFESCLKGLEGYYSVYLTFLESIDKDLLLTLDEESIILKRVSNSEQFRQRREQLFGGREAVNSATEEPQGINVSPGEDLQDLDRLKSFDQDVLKYFDTSNLPRDVQFRPSSPLINLHTYENFLNYYAIAKGELPMSQSIEILAKGMGLHLNPQTSREELLMEMRIALEINVRKHAACYSKALLAIVLNPESFISSSEFERHLRALVLPEKMINNFESALQSIMDLKKYRAEHQDLALKETEDTLKEMINEYEALFTELETMTSTSLARVKQAISDGFTIPAKTTLEEIDLAHRPRLSETAEESWLLQKEKEQARSSPKSISNRKRASRELL